MGNPFQSAGPANRRRGAGWAVWVLLLLCGAVAAGSVALVWNTVGLIEGRSGIERRSQGVREARELLLALQEASISRRGYVLSGDRGYLGQYLAALAELSPHVQKFQRAAGGNVVQQRRVSALEGAIRELLNQWQWSLAHYERQPKDAGQQAQMTRQAGELLKRIQAEIGALTAVQQQWMKAREEGLAREGQAVLVLAASVGAAALALAGVALAWMWRNS